MHRSNAAANCQRHKTLLSRAGDQIKHRAAVFLGGHNVQKTQLVRPRRIISARGFDRIAGIAQVGEVNALDHAAISHVEAGDDAGFQHVQPSFGTVVAQGAVLGKGAVCPLDATRLTPEDIFTKMKAG